MGIREYLKNGPLGFGAAPLDNMFRDIPDAEAAATVPGLSCLCIMRCSALATVQLWRDVRYSAPRLVLLHLSQGVSDSVPCGPLWRHVRFASIGFAPSFPVSHCVSFTPCDVHFSDPPGRWRNLPASPSPDGFGDRRRRHFRPHRRQHRRAGRTRLRRWSHNWS